MGTFCHRRTWRYGLPCDQPERLRHRLPARCREPAQPHCGVRRGWRHPHFVGHRVQQQPLRSWSNGSRRGCDGLRQSRVVFRCQQHHCTLHALPHGPWRRQRKGCGRSGQRYQYDIRPLFVFVGPRRDFLYQSRREGYHATEHYPSALYRGTGTDGPLCRRTNAGQRHIAHRQPALRQQHPQLQGERPQSVCQQHRIQLEGWCLHYGGRLRRFLRGQHPVEPLYQRPVGWRRCLYRSQQRLSLLRERQLAGLQS